MMCSIGYATKIDQNVAFQLGTFGSGTQLKFIRFFGLYVRDDSLSESRSARSDSADLDVESASEIDFSFSRLTGLYTMDHSPWLYNISYTDDLK